MDNYSENDKKYRRDELKLLIEEYNLTVKDLIKFCDVSEQTARAWMVGSHVPNLQNIIQLRRSCKEAPSTKEDAILNQLKIMTELLQQQQQQTTINELIQNQIQDVLYGKKKLRNSISTKWP